MTQSPKRFAELLQESINAIADRTGKPKGLIRDELGYALGRKSGSAIEYWCYGDGHIPSKQAEVVALARAVVAMGRLDSGWLTAFLESAGYSQRQTLITELFPAAVNQEVDKLPLRLTPFVGRNVELMELNVLLVNSDCRLLTLVGPGGIGKTRLAIEVVKKVQAAFADGATFVELASLAAAELVVPTIANALNLTLGGHTDPQTQLLHYLRRQSRLLVLDNFEQLLPSHGHLLQDFAVTPSLTLIMNIITQAPQVTVLVTSRERLDIHGEWIYAVGGLGLPTVAIEGMHSSAHAALEEYGAPLLFMQTAKRSKTNFAPTAVDEAAIVKICRLVNGMPLALELAAAWVRVLSCAEIAQEIARGLDFLTTKQRNLPYRHRSMRTVFDQSWKLLSAEEQQVFARCSIFRGGFTREAAEAVTGATLETLAALVNKSFLSRNEQGHYEIHELARQYGAERLMESSEEMATRSRHLTFFTVLSEESELQLENGPQIVQWHNRHYTSNLSLAR